MKNRNNKFSTAVKVPPHSIEAEQSVLGGIIINNEKMDEILNIIKVKYFYRNSHSLIFQSMIDLYNKDEVIDIVTISENLTENNKIDESGGIEYLASLIESVSTSAGIEFHAKIIKDRYIRRALLSECSSLCEACFNNWHETDELLEMAEQSIFDIVTQKINEGFTPIDDVMEESFKKLEDVSRNKGVVTGVPTGFTDFDNYTAGLQPSDLIIIAARPSMGKTAFALNIGCNAAKLNRRGVAIFSLEMSKVQLGTRMIGSYSKVDSKKLRTGTLRDSDWTSITHAAGQLMGLPIFINDSSSISILNMKAECRKLFRKHDIQMVIVDYIQLSQGSKNSESRQMEISEISRSLKSLAKDLNVPVVALSQLNRKVEDRARANKRPMLSDLRESGSIEQDADIVTFIYRDEVYNGTNDDNRNVAEIIIAKQRNGPIGSFKLTFEKEHTLFKNYISDEYYQQELY